MMVVLWVSHQWDVLTSTRAPVRNLFDYLLAGDSVKDFLEDFPTVSFEQIRYVLQSHSSCQKPP